MLNDLRGEIKLMLMRRGNAAPGATGAASQMGMSGDPELRPDSSVRVPGRVDIQSMSVGGSISG